MNHATGHLLVIIFRALNVFRSFRPVEIAAVVPPDGRDSFAKDVMTYSECFHLGCTSA